MWENHLPAVLYARGNIVIRIIQHTKNHFSFEVKNFFFYLGNDTTVSSKKITVSSGKIRFPEIMRKKKISNAFHLFLPPSLFSALHNIKPLSILDRFLAVPVHLKQMKYQQLPLRSLNP